MTIGAFLTPVFSRIGLIRFCLLSSFSYDKHTQKYTRLVRLEAGTVASPQREDNLGKFIDTKDVAYLTSK